MLSFNSLACEQRLAVRVCMCQHLFEIAAHFGLCILSVRNKIFVQNSYDFVADFRQLLLHLVKVLLHKRSCCLVCNVGDASTVSV
jgi:hypothetical protein